MFVDAAAARDAANTPGDALPCDALYRHFHHYFRRAAARHAERQRRMSHGFMTSPALRDKRRASLRASMPPMPRAERRCDERCRHRRAPRYVIAERYAFIFHDAIICLMTR